MWTVVASFWAMFALACDGTTGDEDANTAPEDDSWLVEQGERGTMSNPSGISCMGDKDCPRDMWCPWTLGTGLPGRCQKDFGEGHSCSRNAHCLSNNCIYKKIGPFSVGLHGYCAKPATGGPH
jgi:hypothetical protein